MEKARVAVERIGALRSEKRKVSDVLEQLLAEGVIQRYAIGGATVAGFLENLFANKRKVLPLVAAVCDRRN